MGCLTFWREVFFLVDGRTRHRVSVDALALVDMCFRVNQEAGTLEHGVHVGRCGVLDEGRAAGFKEGLEPHLGKP